MSQFDSDWLSARRSYDHASRMPPPAGLQAFLAERKSPLEIVDLGAGTGSNLAYLAPRLPQAQRWRLVEQDPAHRSHLQFASDANVAVEWLAVDLAIDLPSALTDRVDLVTASAFLDLVSARWIDGLIGIGQALKAGFLIALTYDGMQRFCPPLTGDADIVGLFNRHQRTDKGFGPALGPTATSYLRERLQDAGYKVETLSTAWEISPDHSAFLDQFLAGVTDAARSMAPGSQDDISRWLDVRREQARSGMLMLSVGHQDLFAWP